MTSSENLIYTGEIQQNAWHKYFNNYRLNDLLKFKYIGILGTLYMHYVQRKSNFPENILTYNCIKVFLKIIFVCILIFAGGKLHAE